MTGLSASGYALIGLTAIVAVLVAILAYAVMRFAAAARQSRRHIAEERSEHALLSTALAEAIGRLKAQERAMAARAEASERFSTQIIDGLTSGLIVVGRDRTVQTINPSARRILQLDGDGRLWERPELAPLTMLIAEVLETGETIARRTVQIGGAAEPTFLGVTVSPLSNESAAPHAVVCLFTDLTKAVAMEEQLRLKEALARLGELTAGLAHEFRNGLATIQGYAQLLDPNSLAEPERAYVEGIRHETQSLGTMVTKFLEFARPDPMTRAPVDLRSVVDRVVADLSGGADVDVAGRFDLVEGDEVLLRQALGNLLRNAVEACVEAGVPPRIHVLGELEPDGRALRLTVADDGPGIPEHALSRVFRPFFTTRAHGTGLGLAIVQKVVVGHNGRISVANRPEGGAVFRLTLPLLAETDHALRSPVVAPVIEPKT
jgi:signal transduction histidine kinase